MRAILIVPTASDLNKTREPDLKRIASSNNWLETDTAEESRILKHVLDDVFLEHKERVEAQWVCSLSKADNPVVGIVGMDPGKEQIEIRLRGNTTGELKAACSEMVDMLLAANEKARSGGMNFGFKFNHHIQILAKGTREPKWDGVVNAERPWTIAKVQEKAQWHAFQWGVALTIAGMVLSFPAIASMLFRFQPQNVEYTVGYLGRFASAALFTAILAYLNLKLRVDDLKREGAITWSPA